jgi:molecular chaperone GrpE
MEQNTEPIAHSDADAAADPSAVLAADLEKARAEAAANLDGWQRSRAEFANYKKRMEAQNAELRNIAVTSIITKMLPVQDDFELAVRNLPESLRSENWVVGVLHISRKLASLLENENVKAIEVGPGTAFNPALHEAITHDADPSVPSGHVIEVVRTGYRLGERVLRPALVRVAQ